MPLSMKKIGMRKPKPIASSLLVIGLAVLALDEEAHHHAGGERAEQHVQAQLVGQVDEQDHQQHRDPDGQLRRRVEVLAHECDEARRMDLRGQEGGDHGDGDEEGRGGGRSPRRHGS